MHQPRFISCWLSCLVLASQLKNLNLGVYIILQLRYFTHLLVSFWKMINKKCVSSKSCIYWELNYKRKEDRIVCINNLDDSPRARGLEVSNLLERDEFKVPIYRIFHIFCLNFNFLKFSQIRVIFVWKIALYYYYKFYLLELL